MSEINEVGVTAVEPSSCTQPDPGNVNEVAAPEPTADVPTDSSRMDVDREPSVVIPVVKEELPKEKGVDAQVSPALTDSYRGRTHSEATSSVSDQDDGLEKRRRRSTRDIKRPKFDDELVDSGVSKLLSPRESKSEEKNVFLQPQSTGKEESAKPSSGPASHAKHAHSLRRRPTHSVEDRQAMEEDEEAAKQEKRRREARIANKDIRCKELAAATEAADGMTCAELRRWTAADDVALVTAVTHVHDLRAAYGSIKFSRPYSLEDIEERWYQLMYDDTLSRQAKKRMNELPVEEILRIQSRTAFTVREEDLLRGLDIGTNSCPDRAMMEELIKKYPEDFHSARTPQSLLDHWHILNSYGILAPGPQSAMLDWEMLERTYDLTGRVNFDETRALNAAAACDAREREYARVVVQPVTGICSPATDVRATFTWTSGPLPRPDRSSGPRTQHTA
ncbi:Microspherule protein 1 [Parelaphostrongylus tenuis]|uniref:Microspherule protein 1 n=1 Tax=Parelaphostrongylus tenuis TaxID=148309 RepID=A0AAD5MHE9_PARTN|nr:Microspherule protein 1 [Parelaphostrongylus tenuis]